MRSIARAKKTASASPLAMMCSACSGSVIRPTAAVGMLASVWMAVAKGTWKFGSAYFFLYPEGHFGFTAVTFLVVLPLMQVIVVFFGATTGCLKLMANCGVE